MKKVHKRPSVVSSETDVTFNREFIAAVKAERCLYDFKLPAYASKDAQNKAWDRLSEQFQESVHSLRDRWKNLRAALTRHIRSQVQLEQSGSQNRALKAYYLLPEMEFLIPFTRVQKPTSMEDPLTESDSGDNYLCDSEQDAGETQHVPKMAYETDGWQVVSPVALNKGFAFSEPKKFVGREYEMARRTPKEFPPELTIPAFTPKPKQVEEPQSTRPANNSSSTDYEQTPEWDFFRSLMPDILSMTASQKRKMRIKFLCTVDEILDDKL